MTRFSTDRAPRLAAALGLLLAAGCESAAIETTTRQMDSAWDVALLCAVGTRQADGTTTWAGTTMDACAQDGEGYLYAFVVQRTRGELAVADLRSGRLLDLDVREPLSSPVSVGPLPNAVAAAADGSRVVVANLGDPRAGEDPANPDGLPYLTVIDPAFVLPRESQEPERVYLPSPASQVAFLDPTHVVVTLPRLSAVAVVTLGAPSTVGDPVVLEPFPLLDTEGNPYPGLGLPDSLLVDPGRARLLVGDIWAARLAWLTWDDTFTLTVAGAVDVPGPVGNMAIEPVGWGAVGDEFGRWIYAVDRRSGGVMVLDAEDLSQLNVAMATHDPMDWQAEIMVGGLAEDVLLDRVAIDPAPTSAEPEVLHGTFGFIISSAGELYAVDVEDHANPACWDGANPGEGSYLEDVCPRHVLRNASASATGPYLSSMPALFSTSLEGDSVGISFTDRPDAQYPVFDHWDDPPLPPAEDPSYGITFDPDPRRAVNQTWIVEYEGVIPWTDGTGGNIADRDPLWLDTQGGMSDRSMPFCARGVLPGDLLIIKDGPKPIDERIDCLAWPSNGGEADLEYRIIEAHPDRLVFEQIADPPPTEDCFPYAVRYEIRVGGQWLVRGEATGFAHRVQDVGGNCEEVPGPEICTPWENCTTTLDDFRCLYSGRAVEAPDAASGVVYKNPYLCFTMLSGTAATAQGYRYELHAAGGFSPLVVETGQLPVAGAVDATSRTGPALLVVDSSTDGLIRVDLDGFTVTDNWP